MLECLYIQLPLFNFLRFTCGSQPKALCFFRHLVYCSPNSSRSTAYVQSIIQYTSFNMSYCILHRNTMVNLSIIHVSILTVKYKKAQHRRWHTAKCNKLYHLKWNINAWDIAMHLHGRNFVRHLGICNPICIELLQRMSGVIMHNSVKKMKSLY